MILFFYLLQMDWGLGFEAALSKQTLGKGQKPQRASGGSWSSVSIGRF